MPSQGTEAPSPPGALLPCLTPPFHPAVTQLYPFIINWPSSKSRVLLRSGSHSSKGLNLSRGSWESLICAGNLSTLKLKVGGSLEGLRLQPARADVNFRSTE